MDHIEQITQRYPFLTLLRQGTKEYICLVQNSDEQVITFYDIDMLSNPEDRALLLDLAEIWWNESNRIVPIDIFMRQHMSAFRYILKTINQKDIEVVFGPVTSLNNLLTKRIKRRQVRLIREDRDS